MIKKYIIKIFTLLSFACLSAFNICCDPNKQINDIIEKEVDEISLKLFFININTHEIYDTTINLKEKEEIIEFKNVFGNKMSMCLCATLCEIKYLNKNKNVGIIKFSGATGYSLVSIMDNNFTCRLSSYFMMTVRDYSDLIRDKLGSGWRIQ
jgi:hypothetical protein